MLTKSVFRNRRHFSLFHGNASKFIESVNSAMLFESIKVDREVRTVNAKWLDDNNITLKLSSLTLGINETFAISINDTF